MKNIFSTVAILCLTTVLYAETSILLSSSSDASIGENVAYVENFTVSSLSGHFTEKNLKILPANEKGFRVMAMSVPKDIPAHYDIVPAYPSFLNEGKEGAGAIENAAAILKVDVEVILNRPYDNIFFMYSTSPLGPVHRIKMTPKDNATVETGVKITFTFDNANYNEDVKTREIKAEPALGGDETGIYFRGFSVQTNPAYGMNVYSPWSIAYFNNVTVTYDKRFTDEQWAMRQQLKEEWGIDDGRDALTEKSINDITYRKKLEDIETTKMHKETSDVK